LVVEFCVNTKVIFTHLRWMTRGSRGGFYCPPQSPWPSTKPPPPPPPSTSPTLFILIFPPIVDTSVYFPLTHLIDQGWIWYPGKSEKRQTHSEKKGKKSHVTEASTMVVLLRLNNIISCEFLLTTHIWTFFPYAPCYTRQYPIQTPFLYVLLSTPIHNREIIVRGCKQKLNLQKKRTERQKQTDDIQAARLIQLNASPSNTWWVSILPLISIFNKK
jgi:hypothetical protein